MASLLQAAGEFAVDGSWNGAWTVESLRSGLAGACSHVFRDDGESRELARTRRPIEDCVLSSADSILPEPLRPKSAFFTFLDTSRAHIVDEIGSRAEALVKRRASEMWKMLPLHERSCYEMEAERRMGAYKRNMRAFIDLGGVPTGPLRKKQKCENVASTPVTAASSSQDLLDSSPEVPKEPFSPTNKHLAPTAYRGMSPKKTRPHRARLCFCVFVASNPEITTRLKKRERLVIKRRKLGCREVKDGGSPIEIALFDRSHDCRVGRLCDDIAIPVTAFAERHPTLRMTAAVKHACGIDDNGADRAVHRPFALSVEVLLSAPIEASDELARLEQTLNQAIARRPLLQEKPITANIV
eukprot:TRINITY_DN67650_c0_g1_i1.p1 TRINITY_DN67650_c0_g1~~TRINITY_DN67650_c0_g1_i1.p1  ORF type:complete len:373 (-),score=46.56 TRINITY_DN67650_c0_g1_i1:252-1316(-)